MQQPDANRPAVLWIGEVSPPEFSRAFRELESVVAVKACASPSAALDQLASLAEEPALLLFAEQFPGEFAAAEVALLRARAPLARCLSLLGSWCEGETRSGKPLPGITRLYWHQWSPQAVEEIEKLIAGQPGEWSFPITATDEERQVFGPHSGLYLGSAVRTNPAPADADHRPVAVWAGERQAGLALAELLTAAGQPAQWLAPHAETERTTWAATLVDLARGTEREWQALATICADQNSGPVIALLGFPRPEDDRRAKEAGAASLISKPTRAAHLLAMLRELTHSAAGSGERHPQPVVG